MVYTEWNYKPKINIKKKTKRPPYRSACSRQAKRKETCLHAFGRQALLLIAFKNPV
jgi:hypothetical protein